MTEDEWDYAEPTAMLEFLKGRASVRKLRLLSVACCRRVWHLLESDRLRQAVDALERLADEAIEESLFRAIAGETHPLRLYVDDLVSGQARAAKWLPAYGIHRVVHGKLMVENQTVWATLRPEIEDVGKALDFFARSVTADDSEALASERSCASSVAEGAAQADLIRDLFGAPFPTAVTIDLAWLAWNDAIVMKLAQAAYEQRSLPDGTLDVGRLAVLADTLEETACGKRSTVKLTAGASPCKMATWLGD